jgi:hypothetical protein
MKQGARLRKPFMLQYMCAPLRITSDHTHNTGVGEVAANAERLFVT